MADLLGRPVKISEMSEKTVNQLLGIEKRKIKVIHNNLTKLYERKAILAGLPVDKDKAKNKIIKSLGTRTKDSPEDRYKQILELALIHLENNSDFDLIRAILLQARDSDDL